MSDAPVLPRVSAGEPGAAEECLSRYRGLIWSIAARMLGAGEDTEDAVQEIFIEIWRSAARFDPEKGAEHTFVATIARRRVVDRVRRRTARPAPEPLTELIESKEPEIDSKAEIDDEVQRARQALESLPEQRRRVLEMSLLEGETHAAISARIGMPLGTVKTHVRRGLIRMREVLGVNAPDSES